MKNPRKSSHGRKKMPTICIGCDHKVVSGDPDPNHVSTSYVELQNLTMRMHMRVLRDGKQDATDCSCHLPPAFSWRDWFACAECRSQS